MANKKRKQAAKSPQCLADKPSEILKMKPFRDTKFGNLPPEIRQIIFTNLLAFSDHDLHTATASSSSQSPTPLITFVDLRGSCLAVLKTCRQIYTEAFPLFYANKSYYVANAQDLVTMLPRLRHEPRIFRLDTITSLCLRNIVHNKPRWSPEDVNKLLSKVSSFSRESLEAERTNELDFELLFSSFLDMISLRKLYLCIQAGQESEVLTFLFNIQGFRGVIDFIDDSRWSIRWENVSRDEWKQQYPGFCWNLYRDVGDFGVLDSDLIRLQKERLDISSRASDLTEGQERWIEIDIGSRSYEDTRQYDEELVQHYKERMEPYRDTPDSVSSKGSESQQETPAEEFDDLSTLSNIPAIPSPSTMWPTWSVISANNGDTQTQVDLDHVE